MSTIACYDPHGNKHAVAIDSLTFLPAAYGLLIENNHILLTKHKISGLWFPPGITLAAGETPTQAVRQHFRRVTGMVPEVDALVFVEDRYLYEEEQGWKLSAMYYALRRSTTAVSTVTEATDNIPKQWLDLADLSREQLQFGYEAIRASELHWKL